jgi:hypothetical protein
MVLFYLLNRDGFPAIFGLMFKRFKRFKVQGSKFKVNP